MGVEDGRPVAGLPNGTDGVISFSAQTAVWDEITQAVTKRFHNDLMANASTGSGITLAGDPVVHAQYYAAIMRAVELLRPDTAAQPLRAGDVADHGHVDTPVGRYVHLTLGGYDHRIYYEEAGQGIPLLMQHTAGCHGHAVAALV